MSNINSIYILGLSCFYHDSAAALIKDGQLVAAAAEERFSRKKHDASFPKGAVDYCLKEAGIKSRDLDYVGFYEKPFLKFERILETYLKTVPKGFNSFRQAIPVWFKEKLWIKNIIQKELDWDKDIVFLRHHLSHAASAFLVSPFKEAAILTLDGVGEWETATKGVGKGNKIELKKFINFPNSIGLLYSAFTYYCGFRINNGEYKMMGLAPYGEPKYEKVIKDNLIEIKDDGSFRLNMKYFSYEYGLKSISQKFIQLFDNQPPLKQKSESFPQHYRDVAASIQTVTEEVILKMIEGLYQETKLKNLCMAGGVALNSAVNGKIIPKTSFENLYIQPAAGDAGGALGTAFYIYNSLLDKKREFIMDEVFYGPSYSNDEIRRFLDDNKASYEYFEDIEKLTKVVARLITDQKVVGWYQDRMEWGPRALGNRTLIADPRNPEMKDIMNAKVKHREPFRPFAPSVLEDKADEYFIPGNPSPFMLKVVQTKQGRKKIPAVTHENGSSRIQTVNQKQNAKYYQLIKSFYDLTGCPVVLNTSFNIRGEPIVNTPENAYNCFINTGIDVLVLQNFVIKK